MIVAKAIHEKLTLALTPAEVTIIDDSAKHAKHAKAHHGEAFRAEGETHFRIRIIADAFAGKTRLERHRFVYDLLADEIADGVHSIALTALTPAEAAVTAA